MTDVVQIHPTALLDQPYRHFQGGKEPYGIEYRDTRLGRRVAVGAGAILGRGVELGDGVVIDHQCMIEPNASIGQNSLLIYRAIVGGDAVIGDDCVIGGFIAERSVIGSRCRIFGQFVHRQVDTTQPWDEHDVPEPSAVLGDDVFVGFGALIIGGVRLGSNAYVCAGALVTRDVAPGYVAYGVNQIVPPSEWPGALRKNPTFVTR